VNPPKAHCRELGGHAYAPLNCSDFPVKFDPAARGAHSGHPGEVGRGQDARHIRGARSPLLPDSRRFQTHGAGRDAEIGRCKQRGLCERTVPRTPIFMPDAPAAAQGVAAMSETHIPSRAAP
jgi:hypothetical protein